MRSGYYVDTVVHTSDIGRYDAIVSCHIDFSQLMWHAGGDGGFGDPTLEVFETGEGGGDRKRVPAQASGDEVNWIMPGETPARARRYFRIRFGNADAPHGKPRKLDLTDRIVVSDLGKELLIAKNTIELARYKYRDVWKPYFFPLNGPDGNVVRDVVYDSEDHHFHHGLWVAYGSMDAPGAVNMWTEDSRLLPRRGPTGKMVHDTFEKLEYGWVFGQLVQRLCYQKPDGLVFARERRTLRVYAPNDATRIIDWTIQLEEPEDIGARPVIFACRVAPSMRVRDLTQREMVAGAPLQSGAPPGMLRENPGKIQDAEGQEGEVECAGKPTRWVDFSGPVENGWNGIALLDHPSNWDYPKAFGVREYGLMNLSRPFPEETRGGVATLRYRAIIHRGDAVEGRIDTLWHDFAHPCYVQLGEPKADDLSAERAREVIK